jgi:hypothetical protein
MSDEYVLLSTKDNPFNPHTEWDEWFGWDYPRYDTNGLLGRTIVTSDELPKALRDEAYNDAVDTIVTENLSGKHIKVVLPPKAVVEDL